MEKIVMKFDEFINEDLNFTTYNDVCEFEDRWFYYNADDDIIYGCDEKPVGEDKVFSFNPISCIVRLGNKEYKYDASDPVCLITYDLDKEESKMYTEKILEYLQAIGFKDNDFRSPEYRNTLTDLFENDEDVKHILLYGKKLIASTFDIIEEN